MRELGGYTLTHRLGVGGMGEVWKGTRAALGGASVDVAIKVLSRSSVDDPEARRMFLDEARLTMLLANSNIVKVFDAGESPDKTCFMVMEWVHGLNLAELTANLRKTGETLPDVIIAYVIGEVLKGLAHAHDLRDGDQRLTIVHRDISPHNVMLSVSGEVKVMDFGVARMASEDTSGTHVKGKLRYMPPEQLRGMSREPTLDLFAVGAMLHELLDGVKFRSDVIDEGRLYGMILDGEIPPMTRPAHTLPNELDDIRGLLLAAKPEDRIQSAREAFRQLTRWPGYRDARFELDEIVRRFAGERELKPAPLPTAPVNARSATVASGVPFVQPVHTDAGSFTAHDVDGPDERGGTSLSRVDTEATDQTDIIHSDQDGTKATVARGPAPAKWDDRRIFKLALTLCGVGFTALLGLALVALYRADQYKRPITDPPKRALVADKGEDAGEADATPPEDEVELAEPRLDLGLPPDVAAAVEATADEAAQESDAGDEEVVEEVEPPVTDQARKPAVATVAVSVSLGANMPWAEVKIGRRKLVLDAFSNKRSTTRLAPGSYNATFRTKVDGQWQADRRIQIPSGGASVTLEKSGQFVVK
ncbi:serine/threonine protein kinase [Enhygromyxa salina]|uniref:Serine/threonine-protein kinase pkn6 n=1 Tax=Enhygromyxa salina TaxID=215803 RepID=A0A2S9YY92_9BACT|nr:serine/threonine-protein kinase [Enhygromyxa salina]PRQ10029.1 Serine/threonine-protein kinase pkn6 [Enhygromyxa salina]